MFHVSSIYVGGSFDLFHWGHVRLLEQAASFANDVFVAVNGDDFHCAYRGQRPVMTELERIRVVEACKYVTRAFIMYDHEHQRPMIAHLHPTYILHGDDWMGESLFAQLDIDEDFLKEYGITMKYVPYSPGISSGIIRHRLRA